VLEEKLNVPAMDTNFKDKKRGLMIFGEAGAGKTTLACNMAYAWGEAHDKRREDVLYLKSCANQWWPAYSGQPVILFEDVSRSDPEQIIQ